MAQTAIGRSNICCGAPGSARGRTSSTSIREMSIDQAVDTLVNYDSVPDDVDSKIGKPGYVGMTISGAVLAAIEHRRRAAALAVPDGAHATVRCRRR